MEFQKEPFYENRHFCFEAVYAELCCVCRDNFGTELAVSLLKALDRVRYRVDRLVGEKKTSRVGWSGIASEIAANCFQRATCPISNDRRPGPLSLDRCESDVFFSGEKERSASAVVIANDAVWNTSEEFDCVSGNLSQATLFFPFANHHQFAS
jgi:hypothetical protein